MSSEQSATAGSNSGSGGVGGRAEEDQAIADANNSRTLESLYDQLLKLSFPDSVTAINHCRELCARFGFTVKQEASTHRNIYVYCSREGQPDSQRNPKTNPPKRRRPSKRCDCRWRVILHENDGRWEFRKSLNPEAASHNHELLRPEEIDRNWPKAVIDFIQQLAREESTTPSMTTADIRGKVQAAFPDLVWNERRFYNRLSEERQKIRHRDAVARARHLTGLWSRVCMVTAGNEDLSSFVEAEMNKLLLSSCQMARMDPAMLQAPVLLDPPETREGTLSSSSRRTSTNDRSAPPPQETKGKGKAVVKRAKLPEPPRGFVSVAIPRHTYFVKIHNQRIANEIHVLKQSESSDTVLSTTPRKKARAAIPAAITTTTASAVSAVQQAQQKQHQRHFVQQQQHGLNTFIYSYGAPLSSLGGPVNPYSQDFQQQQQQQQQTFIQPALFGAQPTLHPGLPSDPMAAATAAHQQHHSKLSVRNIHPHADMYPVFNEGTSSSSQQPQTNAGKSGLIRQQPIMYIADPSSQQQQQHQQLQQSSPQTPMPEHEQCQYPQ